MVTQVCADCAGGACRALDGGAHVSALDEEQTDDSEDQERDDLEGGDEVLPLGAGVLVAHMQPGEEDDQDAAHDADRHVRPAGEVGDVVGHREGHRRDAHGVGRPPAGPDEEHGRERPAGLAEVHELAAVLGVRGGVLGVDEVLRDHDEAAENEREDREQRRAGGAGDLAHGGEDTGTDRGSDAQCDGSRQAKVA